MSDELLRKIAKEIQEDEERIKKETAEYYRNKAEKEGLKYACPDLKPDTRSWEEKNFVDNDKWGTMDNGTATIWYIIVMICGAIFKDRLLIWIVATVIWLRHINRKVRRQKEWDEKHKNGGNK